jgi:AraC-like DNA-binding protein
MPTRENWRFFAPVRTVPGLAGGETAFIDHASTGIEMLLASPLPDGAQGQITLLDQARDYVLVTLGNLTGIEVELGGRRSETGPHSDDRVTFIPAGTALMLTHRRDCSPMIAIGVPTGRLEAMSLGRLRQPEPFALRTDAALAALVWRMMRLVVRGAELDNGALERLTAELAVALANSFPNNTAAEDLRVAIAPHKLRNVLTYVEANLHRPITLADMAAQVRLSPYHFSRVFKHAVGRSPYDHVRWRRLAHGAAMVIRSDMSLTQIAGGTGFANSAHFSDSFHLKSGVPPSLFRKSVRPGLLGAQDLVSLGDR